MDKKILIEYADMKEEIKDLRRRIAEDKKKIEQLNKITVQDSVACGKKAKLQMLETDLLEKQIQVEEYIEKIEKSRLRTMFRLYYIDNLTWEMVAMQMNYMFPKKKIPFTKDSCRMMHDRYLEKVS